MRYAGNDDKIDWTGTTEVMTAGDPPRRLVALMVEHEKTKKPVIALDAGKLVPDNWLGKRVRITVELLP